ncbi:hypothetical protein COHA_005666 [Chlorella ohadii]|uniref:Uncharacterized protein n=1 Tax=Chlorella ohadii TaxID=2649997 RepID=A0AAD5DRF2_9CHLO|nr:hypothetical protein COHA_005666 [Chlorella ohadii]
MMEGGHLMPDAPILRMVRAHFMQALELFADVQLVVNLGLRQEVLVTKIMGRRKCTYCKKTFNMQEIHLPATDDGLPEVNVPAIHPPEQCVGHLEDHSDLTEQQVLAALAEHEREVAPVLRYYKASLVSKRWLRCGAHVGCAEEHKREVAPVLRYYKASLVCKRLLWLRYLQFDYVSGTRERMKLVDFEITGGVDQTLPRLLQLLKPHLEVAPLKPLRVQSAQVGA